MLKKFTNSKTLLSNNMKRKKYLTVNKRTLIESSTEDITRQTDEPEHNCAQKQHLAFTPQLYI